MGEKEVETWRQRILPETESETPNFALFKDGVFEASNVALTGLFASTHAEVVDAEIKLDIVACELERRRNRGDI